MVYHNNINTFHTRIRIIYFWDYNLKINVDYNTNYVENEDCSWYEYRKNMSFGQERKWKYSTGKYKK